MKLAINKIVYPGRSFATGEDGIVVFTDGALPGEVADVVLTKNKKTYKEAALQAIVEPSPDRIVPRCPSYGHCGGCSFQHASYDAQVRIKDGYVRELLRAWGSSVEPIIPSPEQWHYRNKMEFSFFDGRGQTPPEPAVSLGLHRRGQFNRYFPVPPCFICDSAFAAVIDAVVGFARASGRPVYDKRSHEGFFRHLVLRASKSTGGVLVNLVTNADPHLSRDFFAPLLAALPPSATSVHWTENSSVSDAVNVDRLTLLRGAPAIEESLTVAGRRFTFEISPLSFFQTNSRGTELLYATALSCLEPSPEDRLLDLYCGTGTIGIVMAPSVRDVMGVEQVESAVANARENARRNGIENISFAAGSVEKWLKQGDIPSFNAIVVDPPRGGLSNKVIDFIVASGARKVVYVSCNPSTLARDLVALTARGYAVHRAVTVDMFPQTFHVETVVSLRKS